MKTFVIAEAGANHDRNFDQAIELINVAKKAGASAVKFQTYSAHTLYCKNTPDFAEYKNINKLIKDIELPREWQQDLKEYCDTTDIEFMSTPFDEKAVEELVSIGVKRLKISGFEATDFRFIEMVASAKLPLIISLGIGFKDFYLDKLISICSKYTNDITVLHCNNAYPTPMIDADLSRIQKLIKIYGDKVGFSDHTTSTLTPSLAVSVGATTIEKHITVDRNLMGPDHPFALEPEDLEQMIFCIKETEKAFTKLPENKLSPSEKRYEKAMRSVVSIKAIKKGERFTRENITTKRPFLPTSIPAVKYEELLNKLSEKNYEEDQMI